MWKVLSAVGDADDSDSSDCPPLKRQRGDQSDEEVDGIAPIEIGSDELQLLHDFIHRKCSAAHVTEQRLNYLLLIQHLRRAKILIVIRCINAE